MPRRNALLRLHENLLARDAQLRKQLAGELANLRDFRAADSSGDSAALAFEAGSDEMSSMLAELDDRELDQIDWALAHWDQGAYGLCESCQRPIALARLNALPYTPLCISCEREMERSPDRRARQSTSNWTQVFDAQALVQEERIQLAELELALFGKR